MPSLPVAIIPSQFVPNSTTTLYTSGAGVRTRVDSLSVANSTGGSQTFTLYLVPSGGTAGASNEIRPPLAILAGMTWDDPTTPGKVLMPGDSLQVVASAANALTIAASGTQLS